MRCDCGHTREEHDDTYEDGCPCTVCDCGVYRECRTVLVCSWCRCEGGHFGWCQLTQVLATGSQ